MAEIQSAAPAVQAERRTCPTCGTHEVSVEVTCHNSACSAYASGITVYEGWKHPPAAQSADAVDAKRWRMLPAFLEEFQIDYVGLVKAIDAALSHNAKEVPRA